MASKGTGFNARSDGILSTEWLGTGVASATTFLRGDQTWAPINHTYGSGAPATPATDGATYVDVDINRLYYASAGDWYYLDGTLYVPPSGTGGLWDFSDEDNSDNCLSGTGGLE